MFCVVSYERGTCLVSGVMILEKKLRINSRLVQLREHEENDTENLLFDDLLFTRRDRLTVLELSQAVGKRNRVRRE
jgi:hypothetical protein